MPKRRHLLFLLAAAAVVVGVILASMPPEPSYQGRSLSCWVDILDRGYSDSEVTPQEAKAAIEYIGANAVPYLVKWIQYERPGWKSEFYETADSVLSQLNKVAQRGNRSLDWDLVDHKFVRAEATWRAFGILGPRAQGAIPELLNLLRNPKNPDTAERAAQALGQIGESALGPLLHELTNGIPTSRAQIIDALGEMETNAARAIPILVHYPQAQDEFVAEAAIAALCKLGTDPVLLRPILTNALQHPGAGARRQSAFALRDFGSQDHSIVIAFQQMLGDPDYVCRDIATNALLEISPWLLTNPPPPHAMNL